MATISKTSTFEVPKCSQFLFSLGSVGLCLRAGPSGRGSRGETPLHFAAYNGHVSVLERLLVAKAAVDVKSNFGRGLGRENLLRQWDIYMKWMKC